MENPVTIYPNSLSLPNFYEMPIQPVKCFLKDLQMTLEGVMCSTYIFEQTILAVSRIVVTMAGRGDFLKLCR